MTTTKQVDESPVVEMDALDVVEWERDQHTPRAPDAKLTALVQQSSSLPDSAPVKRLGTDASAALGKVGPHTLPRAPTPPSKAVTSAARTAVAVAEGTGARTPVPAVAKKPVTMRVPVVTPPKGVTLPAPKAATKLAATVKAKAPPKPDATPTPPTTPPRRTPISMPVAARETPVPVALVEAARPAPAAADDGWDDAGWDDAVRTALAKAEKVEAPIVAQPPAPVPMPLPAPPDSAPVHLESANVAVDIDMADVAVPRTKARTDMPPMPVHVEPAPMYPPAMGLHVPTAAETAPSMTTAPSPSMHVVPAVKPKRGLMIGIPAAAMAAAIAIVAALASGGSSDAPAKTAESPAARTPATVPAAAPVHVDLAHEGERALVAASTGDTPPPEVVAPAIVAAQPVAPRPIPKRPPSKPTVLEYDPKAETAKLVKPEDPGLVKARASYAAGNQALFAGDTDGAIRAYRQALAQYPGYVAGYRGLGLAYAQRGDKKQALDAFSTYVRTVPKARDVPLIEKRIAKLK